MRSAVLRLTVLARLWRGGALGALLLCTSVAEAAAGWARVPGGLRLSGALRAEDHGNFLLAFLAATTHEPRNMPIALWLASDGGDEGEAVRIAILIEQAKADGRRIATVVPRGHACSGACNILLHMGDERFRTVAGSDLLVGMD